MSQQIDTAFVKQFNATVAMLLQQKGSRLRSCVQEESMSSEEQFFEQVGPVEASEITTRHGDSPQSDTPHDRRRITLRFFDWGDMIDTIDKVRMLIDPQSPYTQNGVMALGRAIDDVLLGGSTGGKPAITSYLDGSAGVFYGVAYTGKAGTTQVPFDTANQQVAVNFGGTNVGLTVPKLIEAKRKLKAREVDLDMEELYAAISAQGEADLLNTTQVTSGDYAAVKALVKGEVDNFLGTTFKRLERIPKNGSSQWLYPMWVKSAFKLGVGKDITTEVARRPDKRFSWYVYVMGGFGGVRMEEGKAVQIIAL